jgi:prophage regulatory protein
MQTAAVTVDSQLPDRLISFTELKSLVGLPYSRATLWRMERRGDFPQRIKLSPRRSAWRLSELRAWIDARPRGMAVRPNAETGAGRKPKAVLSDSART